MGAVFNVTTHCGYERRRRQFYYREPPPRPKVVGNAYLTNFAGVFGQGSNPYTGGVTKLATNLVTDARLSAQEKKK